MSDAIEEAIEDALGVGDEPETRLPPPRHSLPSMAQMRQQQLQAPRREVLDGRYHY